MSRKDGGLEMQEDRETACMTLPREHESFSTKLRREHESFSTELRREHELVSTKLQLEREQVCRELFESKNPDNLWKALQLFENVPFYTSKKLLFRYTLKGGEMFVDRKSKSITRSSIEMAYKKAVEMEGHVSGPKKLGVFGASYLYPVFIRLGVIENPD